MREDEGELVEGREVPAGARRGCTRAGLERGEVALTAPARRTRAATTSRCRRAGRGRRSAVSTYASVSATAVRAASASTGCGPHVASTTSMRTSPETAAAGDGAASDRRTTATARRRLTLQVHIRRAQGFRAVARPALCASACRSFGAKDIWRAGRAEGYGRRHERSHRPRPRRARARHARIPRSPPLRRRLRRRRSRGRRRGSRARRARPARPRRARQSAARLVAARRLPPPTRRRAGPHLEPRGARHRARRRGGRRARPRARLRARLRRLPPAAVRVRRAPGPHPRGAPRAPGASRATVCPPETSWSTGSPAR